MILKMLYIIIQFIPISILFFKNKLPFLSNDEDAYIIILSLNNFYVIIIFFGVILSLHLSNSHILLNLIKSFEILLSHKDKSKTFLYFHILIYLVNEYLPSL